MVLFCRFFLSASSGYLSGIIASAHHTVAVALHTAPVPSPPLLQPPTSALVSCLNLPGVTSPARTFSSAYASSTHHLHHITTHFYSSLHEHTVGTHRLLQSLYTPLHRFDFTTFFERHICTCLNSTPWHRFDFTTSLERRICTGLNAQLTLRSLHVCGAE